MGFGTVPDALGGVGLRPLASNPPKQDWPRSPDSRNESLEIDGRRLPALGPSESCGESGSVLGRPKQVGGLLKAGEFVGRKQGHGFMTTAFQDGRFAAVLYLVPDSGEVRAGTAVGGAGGVIHFSDSY